MRRIIGDDNIERVMPRLHYQRHRRVYKTPYASRRGNVIDLQCQLAEAAEQYSTLKQQRMMAQMPQTDDEQTAFMHLWSEEDRVFRVMLERIEKLESARRDLEEVA